MKNALQPIVAPFAFKSVPGTVEVEVIAFTDGDTRFQVIDESGQLRNDGVSLTYLRKTFRSDEFGLVDPFVGLRHTISLQPWSDRDPDKTFIRIGFRFQRGEPSTP